MEALLAEVFLLWHVHDLIDDFGTHEEVKLIGVFSSEAKAQEARDHLRDKDGFRDFPLDCFEIDRTKVDRMDWSEGFVTVSWIE